MQIVVTGAAGFIGSSLSNQLLKKNYEVIGVDNLYSNYDPGFKYDNISQLTENKRFIFYKSDIRNLPGLTKIFKKHKPDITYHVAALAGIRASMKKPKLYYDVNVTGTRNVYLAALESNSRQFIFSSSSSIYGNTNQVPFREDMTPRPLSPYASTKFEAELMLAKLFRKHRLPTLILRLFSVYGPRGRPDMAPYLFTEAAFRSQPIVQFGDGTTARDYTYIDDVVKAYLLALQTQFEFDIINIGNSSPIKLAKLISTVEKYTRHKIPVVRKPKQPEEAYITYANIKKARKFFKWIPAITFESGMDRFIDWFRKIRL